MKKRLSVLILLLTLFLPLCFNANAEATGAQPYTGYHNLSLAVVDSGNCTAMQAMAVSGNHIYSVKIAVDNSQAILYRTDRKTGATIAMTVDGAKYANNLYHANDMCAAEVNGASYLFIATLRSGAKGVICLKIDGAAATTHAVYGLQLENSAGAEYTASGISTLAVSGNTVKLLITSGFVSYTATADLSAGDTSLYSTLAFQINKENAYALARSVTGSPNATISVQGVGYGDDTFYVPLTVDNRSVILVYPNISKAISVCNTGLTTTAGACIHISNSGYHFFEVESIGVADGILYFSTNRMRINNHSMASISFLTDSASARLDAMEAVRDDGLYQFCGPTDANYVMVDTNSSDGHLTIAKKTGAKTEYFGLESDREGYYFIRCMNSKKYLTVNDDHSVGQEEKQSNDRQRWIVKYTGDGKSAFLSKYNREYLYYDASGKLIKTSVAEQAWNLSVYKNTSVLENLLFDYKLYTACHPKETAGMTQAQALSHWKNTGKTAGYIASMFFDAKYYLANNADVANVYGANNYAGAYYHFLNFGFWEGRQGSMFFSLTDYISRSKNADIKAVHYPDKVAVLNHFLQYGANESLNRAHRAGADSFSVLSCVAEYELNAATGREFLIDYIQKNVALPKVSTKAELEKLLFDAEFYQENNEKLSESNTALMNMPGDTFEEKLLYHWKNYGISEGLVASVYFDPAYYQAQHLDSSYSSAEAYTHFIETGFWQGLAGSKLYNGQHYLYGLERKVSCSHESSVTAIQEASCQKNGSATTYCCRCSEIINSTTLTVPHTEVLRNVVSPTCTTNGYTGDTYCLICNTKLKTGVSVPAPGHNYTYVNNGKSHTASCAYCGNIYNEAHSFANAVCICGAVELVDTSIVIRHSLDLANDIAINYVIQASLLTSYDSCYMECVSPVYDGNEKTGTQSIQLEPVLRNGYYYFIFDGLAAMQMKDSVEATLYMDRSGTTYCSKTDTYSIAQYAYSQLDKPGTSLELKRLCADLLRYGAAAQQFKSYRTDALADGDLTEVYDSYLTDLDTVTFQNRSNNLDDITAPEITWVGNTLRLESRVEVRFVMNASAYTGAIDELSLRVRYVDSEGKTVTETVNQAAPFREDLQWYAFDFSKLRAAELRTVLSAAVYRGDTQVSPTIEYSVDTYCNSKTGLLGDLCKAMIAYSDSANAFFSN